MQPPEVRAPTDEPPTDAAAAIARPGRFEITLDNFTGPFDLLLSLIAKHQMDVTEVALAVVTDEFISYIRAQQEWDLSQASEFLVIAATLLDLKAARLLPGTSSDEIEDLELLEARDLLFARLLQYRAYKEVARHLGAEWERHGRAHPRSVGLEPRLAALLPELVVQIGPEDLARLAAAAFADRPAEPEGVDLSHLHAPVVSVREQAGVIVRRLRRDHAVTFRTMVADAGALNVVVARFLALLELYREGAVAFDQADALAELTIRWTGATRGEVDVADDYDEGGAQPDGAPQEEER